MKKVLATSFTAIFLCYPHAGEAQTSPPSNAAPDSNAWASNDLERLLIAAAKDESQRPAFFKALLNSEVCAMTGSTVPGQSVEHEGKGYRLIGVKAPDGQSAAPIFTSPARAAETFGPSTPLACTKGEKLLDALRGARVVVDPGQPYGIMWTSAELSHMLGEDRMVDDLTKARLEYPTKVPPALLEHLKAALQPEPGIQTVWLALAYWPDQKEWAWYLDVRSTMDRQRVQDLVRDATLDVDMGGRPLDIVVRESSSAAGVGVVVVTH